MKTTARGYSVVQLGGAGPGPETDPWRVWLSEVESMRIRVQYVVDDTGQRTAVLLPLEDWERIQGALEELADIRAYDEAKRHPSDPIPFEEAMAEIDGDASP